MDADQLRITGTAILLHSWASIHKAYLNNIQLTYDRKSVATKRTFAGGVSTMMKHRKEGITITAPSPIEMSALNYETEDLDGGPVMEAHQMHSGDLTPRPFTVVHIAQRQMGLGCIDSWGAWPLPQYRIKYGNHNFSFIITPNAK